MINPYTYKNFRHKKTLASFDARVISLIGRIKGNPNRAEFRLSIVRVR
jgi:hypothetical protein